MKHNDVERETHSEAQRCGMMTAYEAAQRYHRQTQYHYRQRDRYHQLVHVVYQSLVEAPPGGCLTAILVVCLAPAPACNNNHQLTPNGIYIYQRHLRFSVHYVMYIQCTLCYVHPVYIMMCTSSVHYVVYIQRTL